MPQGVVVMEPKSPKDGGVIIAIVVGGGVIIMSTLALWAYLS